MSDHRDGRLARRQVLGLLGTGAGIAMIAVHRPTSFVELVDATAHATDIPACVVRPQLTEGPFFVDEGLLRSDIRTDPSDDSVRSGTRLRLDFTVLRLDDGSCLPFPGVLLDVWHCDAAGEYSDVVGPGSDTRGKKFLRGQQITDADGRAGFVTIYPGWYPGRTVHVHFKLRTDAGLEYTSQLFFADALTDTIFSGGVYASRPERDVRNADDGIYLSGGSELVADVTSDGMGGYTASFALAVEAAAVTTTTTTPGETTTTTLPIAECGTIDTCLTALANALPAAELATSRRERRTARRLQHRLAEVRRPLERAATATGARRARLYERTKVRLEKLRTASRQADEDGVLGVPHDPIEDAVAGLLSAIGG